MFFSKLENFKNMSPFLAECDITSLICFKYICRLSECLSFVSWSRIATEQQMSGLDLLPTQGELSGIKIVQTYLLQLTSAPFSCICFDEWHSSCFLIQFKVH